LRSLLRKKNLHCDVAYVVVAGEEGAARALSILGVLGKPYVVHVMDIYDDAGLSAQRTPAFGRLLEGASSIVALSEPIADEVRKFSVRPIEVIPPTHDRTELTASERAGKPLRIVMIGKPYPSGTQLLADAWKEIRSRHPGVTVSYAGQHASVLPKELRSDLRDYGLLTVDGDIERMLAENHIAYLPGPSDNDYFTRFSIPSRVSDFLMSGLPIVANIGAGSASEKFLEPLIPRSVEVVNSPREVVNAIDRFANNAEDWKTASTAGRQFAIQRLAIDAIRDRVMHHLEHAATGIAIHNGSLLVDRKS
jgi:glycosyltransferase involved in cell wall biosynthesis